jgi:hypothetical protein
MRFLGTTDTMQLYGGVVGGKMNAGVRGGYLPLGNEQVNAMMQQIGSGTQRGGAGLYNLATIESIAQANYGSAPGQFSKNVATVERETGRRQDLTEVMQGLTKFSKGGKEELGEFISAVAEASRNLFDLNPILRDNAEAVLNTTAEIIGMGQQSGMTANEAKNMYENMIQRSKRATEDPTTYMREQYFSGKTMTEIFFPGTMSAERLKETAETARSRYKQTYGFVEEMFGPKINMYGKMVSPGDVMAMQTMREQMPLEAKLTEEGRGRTNKSLKGGAVYNDQVELMARKELFGMSYEQTMREQAITPEALTAWTYAQQKMDQVASTMMGAANMMERGGKNMLDASLVMEKTSGTFKQQEINAGHQKGSTSGKVQVKDFTKGS